MKKTKPVEIFSPKTKKNVARFFFLFMILFLRFFVVNDRSTEKMKESGYTEFKLKIQILTTKK